MAETTQRLFDLLGLLQSRPVWTGPELARRLDVTTRSIRRDVDRLRGLGYPVRSAQGTGGGYQLGAGRALPPLLLADEEAVAIAVSLRLATGTSTGMDEVALRTLTKLHQVLPSRLRTKVRAVHESTATLDSPGEQTDLDTLLGLARACWANERVRFAYRSARGHDSERRVEPYRLVSSGRRWYLMCFDRDRDDWRTFRLDRISALESIGWRFAPRDDAPDPVEYVRDALAVSPYAFTARVRVEAGLDEVAARVPTAAVRLEPIDAHRCWLISGGDDLDWMAWHLARLPFDLEVVEPVELREAMRTLARRLAGLAGPDDHGSGQDRSAPTGSAQEDPAGGVDQSVLALPDGPPVLADQGRERLDR